MTEQRLIDIEIKLAHQERTIGELNAALTDQQAQLTRLKAVCDGLIDKLRSLSRDEAAAGPDDERPPHY